VRPQSASNSEDHDQSAVAHHRTVGLHAEHQTSLSDDLSEEATDELTSQFIDCSSEAIGTGYGNRHAGASLRHRVDVGRAPLTSRRTHVALEFWRAPPYGIAMANSSRLDSDREQQGERHQNQHSQSHLSEWGPVVRENRAPREGFCSESA